ncbi:nucleoside recognition domain-containing protein [Halanaerobium praevalens]|uniref:nucleoside recognition domain-containing protein n=1 Tax=Halanaerobium praevalens TaxID=2331 RepID=UPI00030B7979|nr:nucleoside recognition domain-containing protein [Halanaerobium praevalens]
MQKIIWRGLKKAWTTFLELIKILIPVYIFVTFLKYTGVIKIISDLFRPLMSYIGLPGEAVLALLTSYLLNIYAGIAVISSLKLGVREITILGAMIGIAHSLIIESAVFKKIKINLIYINLLRLSMSILAGILLNLVL